MYRRRNNPYSQAQALSNNRRAIWDLLFVVVLLGGLLNVAIGLLLEVIRDVPYLIALAGVSVVGGGLIIIVALNRYQSVGQTVSLGIALGYRVRAKKGIEIPRQVQRQDLTRYDALHTAHNRFSRGYPPAGAESQRLRKEWQSARKEGLMFTQFARDFHAELLDVILLDALHDYGQESLGKNSRYGTRQVALNCRRLEKDQLPPLLSSESNRFTRAWYSSAKNWYMCLPEGAHLTLQNGHGSRLWEIRHPGHGLIRIEVSYTPWVAPRDRGEYRHINLDMEKSQDDEFQTVGNRITISTSFRILSRDVSAFQEWADGLVASLEEQLDWDYFLERYTQSLFLRMARQGLPRSRGKAAPVGAATTEA